MAKAKKASDALIDLFTPKGKPPRMSAAEAVERGYFHPIGGGLKLSRPVSEMQAEHLPTEGIKMTPEMLFNPEKMVGSASIPLVGDNALGGTDLVALKGSPLSAPVTLQAGRSFPRQNPGEAWASHQGIISGLDSKVDQALMEGAQDVYGAHVSMSPTAVDYNTMVTEAMLRQFDPLDLTKKTAKEFDTAVRNFGIKDKTTGEMKYPARGFVGLRDPELEAQLLSQEGGPLRKIFLDRAQMRQFQLQGLPDVAASRFGISDPTMLDLPLGTTGLDIVKFPESGRILSSSPNPHKTYSTHMAGDYVGGLESPVSYKDYFQDFFDARRLLGNKPSEENYAFMRSTPIQHHDQEWLDRLMKAIEARKNIIKTGEYAEGGMVESPPQEAIADTVQNPNAARMLNMDLANLALMQQPQRMKDGGTPIGDQSVFDLKRPPEPVPPTLREVMAEIGRDPKKYSAEFPPRDFDKNSAEAYQLMQIAKGTSDPERYLESLNPYFDSQIKFDIGSSPLGGYVERSKPNIAVMTQLRDIKNTLPHELEHTLQLQRGKGLDYEDKDIMFRGARLPEEMKRKIFTALNSFENPKETYANVAAYAHLVNAAGGDFVNTPEGKALLPDRKAQSDYYLKTMPGVDSAFGYRENQGEPPEVKKRIDPRQSYARQAMQLLGFAEGGLAKFPTPEEMLIELMERGYGKR